VEEVTPVTGGHTIVIGGGIAGLASAALLARDGHRVTLLESNDTLGGRAGTWTEQGFRFETGPSWYLMPGVFDHFYRLFGTSSAEQLELSRLDPGYRVFFEDDRDPIDIRADRADNIALFESVEPGAGAALDRYLDSAEDTYRMAVSRFLYTSFQSFRPLLVRDVLTRIGRLGCSCSPSTSSSPGTCATPGCARYSATRLCSWVPHPTRRPRCTT
jgi:phytoene desaturase